MIAARRRGVMVQVMLNPARRSGEEENEETRKELTKGGIEVIDSSPDFDLTHEKSMVVDGETAFVCRNFTCSLPMKSQQELERQLKPS